MRTTQITIVCLTLGLVLAAAPAFGAAEQSSNTRSASCIVRITADPDILPLNPTMVEHLIRNSAVAGKAARDVFGLDAEVAVNIFQGIRIVWLSQTMEGVGVSEPFMTDPERGEAEMVRQLEQVYGEAYTRQLGSQNRKQPSPPGAPGGRDKPETQEPAATNPPAAPPETDGRRERGGTSRSEDSAPMGMGMGGGMMGGGMSGGMRGMSGGMGGGMGGYGGGIYAGWVPPAQSAEGTGRQQTAMIRLSVQLPEGIEPKAGKFVKALVDNLEQALQNSYNRYERLLSEQIEFAEFRREEIEQQLGRNAAPPSPASTRIREQLSTIVDVSALMPETPFSEAIDVLKNSVEPPLPIVVLWKELNESCGIEPATPIGMDGLPTVKLETALRTVIAAVGGGLSDVSYQIDDDVIVIREEELQSPQAGSTTLLVQEDVQELAARRRDLSNQMRNLEMQMAGMEAVRQAIEEQIAQTRSEADRRLSQDAVTRELQKLVQMNDDRLSQLRKGVDAGRLLPESELAQAEENLARARIELARRQEELTKAAGGGRLDEFTSQLSQMAIQTAEQRARLGIYRTQLDETQRQLARASAFDPQAARLRTARQALDIAERNIAELTNRQVNLQRPTVTVMAAEGL